MYLERVRALGHVSQVEKAHLYSPSAATLQLAAVHEHPLFSQMQVVPPQQGLVVFGRQRRCHQPRVGAGSGWQLCFA